MKYKLRKAPKRPKRNASIEVKERYLQRLIEIKKLNQNVLKMIQKSRELDQKITKAIQELRKV